jgi:aspartyl-tRNA(Asn)/glutamyl-tRNA(Gln) amidotransferase subunit C
MISRYFLSQKRDPAHTMSLTTEQIQNIAHLARLELTPAEIPVYGESLSRILDLVSELSGADTATTAPMAHPLADQVQRLRPDAVSSADERDRFQQNAPQVDGGLYLVPRVIE